MIRKSLGQHDVNVDEVAGQHVAGLSGEVEAVGASPKQALYNLAEALLVHEDIEMRRHAEGVRQIAHRI